MGGFIILLSLLVIGCVLCGPAALIISIIALNRTKAIYPRPQRVERPAREDEVAELAPVPEKPAEVRKEERPVEVVTPARVEAAKEVKEKPLRVSVAAAEEKEKAVLGWEVGTLTLEQRIGTQWILIAGIIAVIVGAGFFLKYAYDNEWIGPTGRVVIVAVAGLIALAAGEVTRRRGYGIVAKAVTALGFALLYLSVFAAYGYYHLFDSQTPAFVLAVLVTLAAMLYAVSLN